MRPDSPARSGTSLLLPQENKTGGEGKNELRGCKPTPPWSLAAGFGEKIPPKRCLLLGGNSARVNSGAVGLEIAPGAVGGSRTWQGSCLQASSLTARNSPPRCSSSATFPLLPVAHWARCPVQLPAHGGVFDLGAAQCCGEDGQVLTLALSCSPAVPPPFLQLHQSLFSPPLLPQGLPPPRVPALNPPPGLSVQGAGVSAVSLGNSSAFSLSLSPPFSFLPCPSPFSLPASLLLQL